MKERELRIGNWVLMPKDFECFVVGIWGDEVLVNFQCNEGDLWNYKPEHLKGISLNEEWLVKFGFIYANFLGSWDLPSGDFGIIKTNNSKFILENWRSPEIEYVHQLQNLYFALTGEELEIK